MDPLSAAEIFNYVIYDSVTLEQLTVVRGSMRDARTAVMEILQDPPLQTGATYEMVINYVWTDSSDPECSMISACKCGADQVKSSLAPDGSRSALKAQNSQATYRHRRSRLCALQNARRGVTLVRNRGTLARRKRRGDSREDTPNIQ